MALKHHFTPQTHILSAQIPHHFTYYLLSSHQVPSSLPLPLLLNPHNSILPPPAFIIQFLPPTQHALIE
ncbi:Hsp33 family molecular chaperone HslO, partial [Bacillus pumilus]|uniref:Hsp33 family molecular chaperone HslO n=1 Tax=Bacillus pumilus TaxID=1408 RepID=UPI003703EEBD